MNRFVEALTLLYGDRYRAKLLDSVFKMLQPREDLTPVEWCQKYVYLCDLVTSKPGMFQCEPYMVEWLNNLATDIQFMIFQKSAQIGYTLFLQLAMLWIICNRPQPSTIAFPTDDLAELFANERWLHMVRNCKPVMERLVNKRYALKTLSQQFTTLNLNLTGVGSAQKTSSKPAGTVLADEVNKMLRKYKGETGAIQLLKHRSRTYEHTRQMIIGSTPTEEDGEIESEVIVGDERQWTVCCPACKGKFVFEWHDQKRNKYYVTWDKDYCYDKDQKRFDPVKVRATAYYECECGFHINNSTRRMMLKEGIWVPQHPSRDPRYRSYHVNALIGPDNTWGSLAVDWLTTVKKPGGRKDWDNSTLGKTTKWVAIDAPDLIKLQTLTGPYKRRQVKGWKHGIPDDQQITIKDILVITTVDVQSALNGYKVTTRAYLPNGESYLVDYVTVYTLADCARIAKQYGSARIGMDATNGDDRDKVLEWCYLQGPHWIAMVSMESLSCAYEPKIVDRFIGTKGKGTQLVNVLHFSHEHWNRHIANARAGNLPGWFTHAGEGDAAVPAEYCAEMVTMYEAKITTSDGFIEHKWKSKGEEHAFDTEKMNACLFSYYVERHQGYTPGDDQAPEEPRMPLAFKPAEEAENEYGTVGSLYE